MWGWNLRTHQRSTCLCFLCKTISAYHPAGGKRCKKRRDPRFSVGVAWLWIVRRHPMCLCIQRTARWNWVLTCFGAALVALWLTLGDLQRLNHADSLIPTFVSLYRWTWFYWGQNRYGMLTSLLAMPLHHPLINLLFQNWMVSFCGLLVFPLAHAYLLGWRTAPLSGVAGAAVLLLAGPDCFHMDYLLANQ